MPGPGAGVASWNFLNRLEEVTMPPYPFFESDGFSWAGSEYCPGPGDITGFPLNLKAELPNPDLRSVDCNSGSVLPGIDGWLKRLYASTTEPLYTCPKVSLPTWRKEAFSILFPIHIFVNLNYMSGEYLEISIVKAEGMLEQCQSIGCYVQVDGRLHDVITPLHPENQENEVLVPAKGLLRLIVKNMGCAAEVLGSVSFELKLLPTEGFQWLPLFHNMAKDQIFELPEEVGKNKLLILVNPGKGENTREILEVEETTSMDSINLTELQEYLHREKNRHELEVTRIEKQYKGFIETLTVDSERFKKGARRFQLLYEDVMKELKTSKILLVEERKLRLEVQENITRLGQEYEESLKRANSREDSLLHMLEAKDQEISQLNSSISQLKSSIRSLEHEKQQIVDVVDEYKTELTLSSITRLSQELTLVKGLLEESEAQRRKLQTFMREVPETHSRLSSFMSPISLGGSVDPELTVDMVENRQINRMLEDIVGKDKSEVACKGKEEGGRSAGKGEGLGRGGVSGNGKGLVPLVESGGEEGGKTHRRGVTLGATKFSDENEEVAKVRGLKSPPDSSFMLGKSSASKSNFLQTTTPLRERNSNKRFGKKIPFK